MEFKDYKKYRWFYTSSKKLVIGGKSAEQNDALLQKLKKEKQDFFVLHTSSPGSPFSVILDEKSKVSERDLEETAVFTGCFSRAWREGNKKIDIDIFSLSDVFKSSSMSTGTWGLKTKPKKKTIKPELVLTFQKDILRAVPEISATKSKILVKILPGKTEKIHLLAKLHTILPKSLTQEEILSALPSGGIKIKKWP